MEFRKQGMLGDTVIAMSTTTATETTALLSQVQTTN